MRLESLSFINGSLGYNHLMQVSVQAYTLQQHQGLQLLHKSKATIT